MKTESMEKSYSGANPQQIEAITTIDGPVLITAGPGTGKTFTLVQRIIYLIEEKGITPEEIMIATFTEKAAKELVTRITNELLDRKININVNEMYIGTFHSICLRIIKEHLEYTRIKKNYRTLDSFDQQYMIFQNINRFRTIPDYDKVISIKRGAWKQSSEIASYVCNLIEELVVPEVLQNDEKTEIAVLGRILKEYLNLLSEENAIDFSTIQTEAYHLLVNNPEILDEIQEKIKYIMVDEYQDTNFIQEQLVFLFGSKNNNICVVGDDDQGLYRFRGATIRNILEFPNKFEEGECKIIQLVTNYRSNSTIVDFYNEWMEQTEGGRFKFGWDNYRYKKRIIAHEETKLKSPAVIKLSGTNDIEEWYEKILNFIKDIKASGQLTDYNQIAFLFRSVKGEKTTNLAKYLEDNGIRVYSPRANMYFDRKEIKLTIGCLLLMFPNYVRKLQTSQFEFVSEELQKYYFDCVHTANNELKKPENQDLFQFIRGRGLAHISLAKNTDYAYTGLLYQLFEFDLFKQYLDQDMDSNVVDLRPARNLATFSQITNKFEYLHRKNVLTVGYIDVDTELLFNMYMKFLYEGGIDEYEDDAEYAPSGCVSFLTIHQSKGMEFPIVIVDSLGSTPRKDYNNLTKEVEEKYFQRQSYEPYDAIKFFDFWRLYYTAFSRAQDLLILSCNESKREPSLYFENAYCHLRSYGDEEFDISEFTFHKVKDVNIKDTFSFTSHISVYDTCSLQYKFFKELGFTPVRIAATVFGQIVHQTIEDIHRAALREEYNTINPENIKQWLAINYATISKAEHTYLAKPQIDAALNQVNRYANKDIEYWKSIRDTEIEVGLVKPDYILEGKIDLVKGEGDTVELIDFKSEKKPDLFKDKEKIDRYKKQLQIYAHLVEEKMGVEVSKLHLYYTSEEDGVPKISFPKDKVSIDETIKEFESTVHKIQNKEYCTKSTNQLTCNSCDFRHYCKK